MIKCFYEKCDNYFCPECYNRNKHQQRDKGESCNLVPCEICQRDMCIMTSILCSHCDKRICNNCFTNEDIEIHRSNIKIKKNNLNYKVFYKCNDLLNYVEHNTNEFKICLQTNNKINF